MYCFNHCIIFFIIIIVFYVSFSMHCTEELCSAHCKAIFKDKIELWNFLVMDHWTIFDNLESNLDHPDLFWKNSILLTIIFSFAIVIIAKSTEAGSAIPNLKVCKSWWSKLYLVKYNANLSSPWIHNKIYCNNTNGLFLK